MERSTKRYLGLAIAIAAVVGIGWVDWVTGPNIGFSLFYLLPVVWAGWAWGRGSALVISSCSAGAWFLADVAWQPDALDIAGWNGLTRLLMYGSMGWLTATVRADRRRLELANERLRDLISREAEVARTDPLTGLPNWRGLREHMERDLERARKSGAPLSLLYLDLDGFKKVNDLFGHNAGDELLRQIARAIRDTVRASDVAARVGGDEFVVLMSGADVAEAVRAGERLVQVVRELGAGRPEAPVGVSIGVGSFAPPLDSVDALVRCADQAMYGAKRAGRNRVEIGGAHPEAQATTPGP